MQCINFTHQLSHRHMRGGAHLLFLKQHRMCSTYNFKSGMLSELIQHFSFKCTNVKFYIFTRVVSYEKLRHCKFAVLKLTINDVCAEKY